MRHGRLVDRTLTYEDNYFRNKLQTSFVVSWVLSDCHISMMEIYNY